MPAAVLFDLDGTLADTAADLHAAALASLRDVNIPEVPFAEAREYIGDGMPRFIKRLLTRQWWGEPAASLFNSAYERFMLHYLEHCTNSKLYNDVPAVLEQLTRSSYKMACVTNKATRYTDLVLESCRLSSYFGSVVCGDTLPVKKPDPAPLHEAMSQLSVSAADTVMVGDSIADSRAAAAAGCKFIYVHYGYHRQSQPPPADARIHHITDIVPLLCAW